jgi:hypothetical protein
MTRFLLVLFGLLTLGASYLTMYDVGVAQATVDKHSVRSGSAHRGHIGGGGFRHGK